MKKLLFLILAGISFSMHAFPVKFTNNTKYTVTVSGPEHSTNLTSHKQMQPCATSKSFHQTIKPNDSTTIEVPDNCFIKNFTIHAEKKGPSAYVNKTDKNSNTKANNAIITVENNKFTVTWKPL